MRARTMLGTGTVAALALTGLVASPAVAAEHPVINEFSADVNGTDTDAEFVEVHAAPGSDLSGHTIVIVEGDSNSNQGKVIRADAAPAVDASGFGVLRYATNGIQNGSASILLVQGTATGGQVVDADKDGVIDEGVGFTVVDAVGVRDADAGDLAWGTILDQGFDGGSATVGGASRVPDGTDTDRASDWVRNAFNGAGIAGFEGTTPEPGQAWNTPGVANRVVEVQEPPADITCESDAVTIGSVQGAGDTTPVAGSVVTVRGTVVGDWQEGGFNGFHLQDAGDGDAATSDAVFVYAPGADDVAEGDLLTVTGTAGEFQGQTQLTNPSILDCGAGTVPAAVALELPIADEERFEGMLVTLPQELSILEYFNFGRYGEVVLGTDRQMQPTAVAAPGSAEAAAVRAANAEQRITVDDGRSVQNADPAIHPGNLAEFTLENDFRGGDTITGLTGVLEFRNSTWKLQPTDPGTYTAVNERPAAPEIEGASLEVASFNVLNYFTTLNDRGAVTAEEFERQEAKIVAAIDELDSAIVGLLEIENNDGAALDTLVAALNEVAGTQRWAGIDTGTLGTDAITTALIYQPALVEPAGAFAALDETVDARFDTAYNRPALAQSFRDLETDRILTVAVNHLKSKGSACPGDSGSPEQGNCNGVRTAAAAALADWLEGDPTGQDAEGSLIIGDLNAYDHEDPITTLEAADYTDLLEAFQGEEAYTYVFDGQLGYLDYGLADAGLMPFVAGAAAWHANADEVSLIDYTMAFKQPAQDALFAPDPYRASDHDAVVIGLAWEALPPVEATLVDYAGDDRYETNALVSADTFEPGTDVVLASGEIFADALAAGPAAARAGESLLLTPGGRLLEVTAEELERLQPERVTVLGGPSSVSSAVVRSVLEIVPGATVERIAGADRYETAALVAERYFGTAEHAFIASGQLFPDAVSASGTASAIGDVPVLLTPQATASPYTVAALESLEVASATLLGARASVSDAALVGYRAAAPVERFAGADRYATNAMLVERFIAGGDDQAIAMATGFNFPDALSASMVAGALDAPVLLAARSCVTLDVAERIAELEPTTVVNVGGLPSLSPEAWRTGC
ncbi:ExeM/NucH family extracellular endonuclease [Agrococcus sp. Marseille-Q4369]|uniref:ExeM/NucH family extracellular endonuclease n=1 Tax=Agrococcus sp. Marseille-Q4369 TaxID=2810513 RepID=UPI001B8D6C32|nr:ExeM/NucH family extracellular endonuclease [Agrococcus sp. Marseille-Q4369]QUW19925.1 ExeM/NucH family extracellular endonuclease [Agrococcus sp. Marseille-Q4369]